MNSVYLGLGVIGTLILAMAVALLIQHSLGVRVVNPFVLEASHILVGSVVVFLLILLLMLL